MYSAQLAHLSEKARPWCNTRLGFPAKAGQEQSSPSPEGSEGPDLAATRSSQGDCVLFNALLTFAGVEEAVGYVPACIAPDGRPVRSPDLVDLPSETDGFSKDMLLGVLLWTLVTRDPAPLDRLIGYINRTGCLCEKASDRRCTLTPQMTYLTNQVAKAVGCTGRLKGAWMPGWLFAALEVASAFATPLGYQCHLISVKALISGLLGNVGTTVPATLARRDPANPWFLWLAGDRDRAALTLLSLQVKPGQGHQWAWERDSKERAWHDSMGWDLLFMTNLLMDEKGPPNERQ
jgi:hypothetical protein